MQFLLKGATSLNIDINKQDLCSYKHNFCQKGITDNRSQKIQEPETGAFDLIKLIGLNLPKDCDITQSKITKLNNFIVFTHNFFCPGILLGYVDQATFFQTVFVYMTAESYALCSGPKLVSLQGLNLRLGI